MIMIMMMLAVIMRIMRGQEHGPMAGLSTRRQLTMVGEGGGVSV
jgi:hypothetical protein